MKLDSIKNRLLLITGVCLLGMLLLIANQLYFSDRLVELHRQSNLLLSLSNDLLQMRRHEKDFLLRKDSRYYQQFEARAKQFNADLEQVARVLSRYHLAEELTAQMRTSFEQYHALLGDMVALQIRMGLSAQQGELGKLDELTRQLAQQVSSQPVAVQALFWQLLAIERTYLVSLDQADADTFNQRMQALRQALPASARGLLPLLNEYQTHFNQLHQMQLLMGQDHNQGLQGEFRKQAHLVEENLQIIDNSLQPLIESEGFQIKMNGILIMALTCGALVLLLLRSFVTFQRAFANFVMFFYRCKREYQHMDERKLGFAEFKSLANVANEMVDARRETELQLKLAQKNIKSLQEEVKQLKQTAHTDSTNKQE